ncbi:MAG TPA: alanyl-tRNA editing protein [Thermoplasmata archaeon]|nr:alanyl-tRNA editing protein [Thermoplasmata archaeon]
MTELAYLVEPEAAYVRSFRARVTALPPGGVVLERTFFYPTGGGQPNDRGTIGLEGQPPATVVDVSKSGASVVHRLRGSPAVLRTLSVGAEVEGVLDWDRRYRHMRLHTGQHLLSARIFARTGLRTRRAQLAGSAATLDLEGALGVEVLPQLAEDLTDAIRHPRPVKLRHVPRAEWDRNPFAERSGLVALPTHVDPVRVVEIEAADVCPCGGTHLRTTAEIGRVSLIPPVPTSGGERVGFRLDDPSLPAPTG